MYGWAGHTADSRQILVTKVAKGSPADGVLREGDVILGVGGRPFDGDARDVSGFENHGTVQGARLTNDRQGEADSAYDFDGIDQVLVFRVLDMRRDPASIVDDLK